MSDTILGGDITVFYAADNNRKAVKWSGSVDGKRTCNEVYSALQDLFDDPSQMDDLVPIKADTPDIYRIQNQWFVDDDTVEHFTGGSIFSDGWAEGSNEHILTIGYGQTTEFSIADIGRTIVGTTSGDEGTILDFNTIRNLISIRPDDPAVTTGDEFDNGFEAYTIRNDGFDQVWANDGGATWNDETIDANDTDDNDWNIFDTGAAADIAYFGFAQQFSKLIFDNLNGTAGTVGDVTWEYWNGTAWTALTGVTDGTTGFTVSVADGQELTFDIPSDWVANSVNGSATLFFIRADVGTAFTIAPIYDQGFVGGVGAGSFASHNRHGVGSKAGESAWVGLTTIDATEADTHTYISQEDPDLISNEALVTATKGTSDWWPDGQLDILLKVKEADNIFGQLPNSSPATAVATAFARQYSKTSAHFILTGLATAGGISVAPLSSGDDPQNITGSRNLIWDNGSGDTLVDEELLYNVGSSGAGNLDAVVRDDGGTFEDDTTDANSIAAGDVAVWNDPAVVEDAIYFGKDNLFTLLMVDVGTAHNGTTSTQVWEYWDGSAWQTLTVTDDTDGGNGAFDTTGRGLISWTAPSDWARRNITNQPITASENLYYVRNRISVLGDITTEAILDTVWVGGETQLKARVSDTGIVTPGGATGNADYYLLGDPLTDFSNDDVVIAATSRKSFDVNGGPTNVGPAADTVITITHGEAFFDVDGDGTNEPYSMDLNNTTNLAVTRIYERLKFLTRRGETATASTDGQQGQFYIGNELQIEYTGQAGGNFVEGMKVYDQSSDAEGVIVADHDDGATGDLILRTVRGTFVAGNVVSDSPDPSQTMNSTSFCYQVEDTTFTVTDESVDAASAGGADVLPFPATEQANDYFAIGAVKPFGKVRIDIATQGVDGGTNNGQWQYWNGTAWVTLEGQANFTDGTADLTAVAGFQELTFDPPVDWQPRGISDGTTNSGTLYFIRLILLTADYSTNPVLDEVQVEDFVTATIGSIRAIAPVLASPFGTFPGGSKLFFASGASPDPDEMAGGESQLYQTIDDNNNTNVPPNLVSMTITNIISGDTVTVFKRTGSAINKSQFTLAAGNNQSAVTLVVNEAIGADNPNTANSKVRVISVSGDEHRYRYASYSTSTFTLATGVVGGTSDGGSSSNTRLHDTTGSPFTNAEVGDQIRNTTQGVIVKITNVVDANNVDTEPLPGVTEWDGDSYDYNVLMEDYTLNDNAYVPVIERIADTTTESNNVVHSSDIDVRVDVRNAGVIRPFSQDTSIESTGRSTAAVRDPDTIFT